MDDEPEFVATWVCESCGEDLTAEECGDFCPRCNASLVIATGGPD